MWIYLSRLASGIPGAMRHSPEREPLPDIVDRSAPRDQDEGRDNDAKRKRAGGALGDFDVVMESFRIHAGEIGLICLRRNGAPHIPAPDQACAGRGTRAGKGATAAESIDLKSQRDRRRRRPRKGRFPFRGDMSYECDARNTPA